MGFQLLQLGSSWTAADVSTEKNNNPISAEIGLKFWALTISKAQKRINSTTDFRWWILTPIAPVGLQLDCCRRLYFKKNNPISAEIGLKFWALTISKAQKRINSTGFRWWILTQIAPVGLQLDCCRRLY